MMPKLHDRLHQTLADAFVPKVRTNRQGPEKSDGSKVGREIRADKLAIGLRGKCSIRIAVQRVFT